MSRIIRTVSLTKETDRLAANKPNFSSWVREQLIRDEREVSQTHVTPELFNRDGLCSPSMTPRCNLCYPEGKPPLELIKKWNTLRQASTYYPLPDNQGRGEYPESVRQVKMKESVAIIKSELKDYFSKRTDIVNSDFAIGDEKKNKNEPLDPPLREKKYLRRALRWIWAYI